MSQANLHHWMKDPTTKVLFKRLRERKAQIAEFLAGGGSLETDKVDIITARYVGTVDAIDDILSLAVFESEVQDEE